MIKSLAFMVFLVIETLAQGVLFRPIDYNHKGYDLYLFDRRSRIFYSIQISISSDASKHFLECLSAMTSKIKTSWIKYLSSYRAFEHTEDFVETCSCVLHHHNNSHPIVRAKDDSLPIEFAYIYIGPLNPDDSRFKETVIASPMRLFNHILVGTFKTNRAIFRFL